MRRSRVVKRTFALSQDRLGASLGPPKEGNRPSQSRTGPFPSHPDAIPSAVNDGGSGERALLSLPFAVSSPPRPALGHIGAMQWCWVPRGPSGRRPSARATPSSLTPPSSSTRPRPSPPPRTPSPTPTPAATPGSTPASASSSADPPILQPSPPSSPIEPCQLPHFTPRLRTLAVNWVNVCGPLPVRTYLAPDNQ